MIPIKRKLQSNNCLNFGLYTLVISIAVSVSSTRRRKGPDVVMTPGPSSLKSSVLSLKSTVFSLEYSVLSLQS